VVAARPAARQRRRASDRRRAATLGVVAAVAAAAAAAVLAVAPAGHNSPIAPAVANGQTLVLLADKVAAAPRHGDATLVYHRNAIRGEGSFTGADLYLDNGLYYYAPTPAGLPAAVKAGPQDFSLKHIITAMARASSADPDAARAAFLRAADPLYGGDVQHESRTQQDNVIWVAAIDVLGAAYGRPPVLAGTLRALSTVHGVTVKHSTLHGVPTLEIAMFVPKETANIARLRRVLRAKLKAAGHLNQAQRTALQKLDSHVHKTSTPAHFMRATLNDRTGAFLRYTDIGLVVTYHVSRVNAATYRAR
jgi:hypothetical protein